MPYNTKEKKVAYMRRYRRTYKMPYDEAARKRRMMKQLENAEREIQALEKVLIDQGYVNTIHDVWEKQEEPKDRQ
jgi:hypothetical protein